MQWELSIARYETQSQDKLNDALKIAIVSKHAPSEVKLAIRSSQRFIGDSYDKLRSTVVDYVISGKEFSASAEGIVTSAMQSSPTDMEVDAVSKGWKGIKGKGKKGGKKSDHKSEAKGYGDKGWGKGKGKQSFGGKAYPKATATSTFNVECSNCGRWSHKRAQC